MIKIDRNVKRLEDIDKRKKWYWDCEAAIKFMKHFESRPALKLTWFERLWIKLFGR